MHVQTHIVKHTLFQFTLRTVEALRVCAGHLSHFTKITKSACSLFSSTEQSVESGLIAGLKKGSYFLPNNANVNDTMTLHINQRVSTHLEPMPSRLY